MTTPFSLWIFTIAALFIQELASTGAILLAAYRSGFDLWIVHAIWFFATVVDITIGFLIGTWIKRTFHDSKPNQWAERGAKKAEQAIGKNGTTLSLILLGFLNFPYANGFIAAWITGIGFREMIVATMLGDLLWYLFVWGSVIGISTFVHDARIAIVVVMLAGIAASYIGYSRKRR